jgi:hypothetical protein
LNCDPGLSSSATAPILRGAPLGGESERRFFAFFTLRCHKHTVYWLIYLGLEQISRKWPMRIKNWKAVLRQFAILYEDRLPLEALGDTKA